MPVKFFPTSTQYCPLRPWEEADGKTYIYAIAHGTLVVGTPYMIIANEYGNLSAALADSTVYCYVGIATDTNTVGEMAKFQIGGYCAAVTTTSDTCGIGQAYKLHNGTVICTDADYAGNAAEFAVAAETISVAATSCKMMLIPERILTTT